MAYDREFEIHMMSQRGIYLQHLPDEFRSDRDVVLAAVTSCGIALRFASPELRSDKDVVLAAVMKDADALEYAAAELQSDREVVLEAARQNVDGAMMSTSDQLLADRDFMLEVVRQSGEHALEYASEAIRADRVHVLAAVDSPIAQVRTSAPVFNVYENVEDATGYIDVRCYTMDGTPWSVRMNGQATLNDLAAALVRQHGRCRYISLVMQNGLFVTPWDYRCFVRDFAERFAPWHFGLD